MNGKHKTWGIEAYVTNDRFILIDTTSMWSPSVLTNMITRDDRLPPTVTSHHNYVEWQAIQTMLWLQSVCHVVLVVADWLQDLKMWKLLRTVQMLRPTVPTRMFLKAKQSGAQKQKLAEPADIVFVFTKLRAHHITPSRFLQMQSMLEKFFKFADFQKNGVIRNQNLVMDHDRQGRQVNIFFLPRKSDHANYT